MGKVSADNDDLYVQALLLPSLPCDLAERCGGGARRAGVGAAALGAGCVEYDPALPGEYGDAGEGPAARGNTDPGFAEHPGAALFAGARGHAAGGAGAEVLRGRRRGAVDLPDGRGSRCVSDAARVDYLRR